MRLALLALALVACKSHLDENVKVDDQVKASHDAEAASSASSASSASEKRVEAPVDIETTRSRLAVVVEDAAGGVTIARIGPKPLVLPKGAHVVGTVPLSEVKRDEHRGPVVDEKASAASSQLQASAHEHDVEEGEHHGEAELHKGLQPDVGCEIGLGLWAVAALVGVSLLAWFLRAGPVAAAWRWLRAAVGSGPADPPQNR